MAEVIANCSQRCLMSANPIINIIVDFHCLESSLYKILKFKIPGKKKPEDEPVDQILAMNY